MSEEALARKTAAGQAPLTKLQSLQTVVAARDLALAGFLKNQHPAMSNEQILLLPMAAPLLNPSTNNSKPESLLKQTF
jgi:hypothetical protein